MAAKTDVVCDSFPLPNAGDEYPLTVPKKKKDINTCRCSQETKSYVRQAGKSWRSSVDEAQDMAAGFAWSNLNVEPNSTTEAVWWRRATSSYIRWCICL